MFLVIWILLPHSYVCVLLLNITALTANGIFVNMVIYLYYYHSTDAAPSQDKLAWNDIIFNMFLSLLLMFCLVCFMFSVALSIYASHMTPHMLSILHLGALYQTQQNQTKSDKKKSKLNNPNNTLQQITTSYHTKP